jgi:hypothetical protein
MAGFIQDEQTLRYYLNSMNNRNYETPGFDELIISLGEDGLALLWSTLQDLLKIAKKWDFTLDLHPGNFMLGSDGHVVISDPFYNAYQ